MTSTISKVEDGTCQDIELECPTSECRFTQYVFSDPNSESQPYDSSSPPPGCHICHCSFDRRDDCLEVLWKRHQEKGSPDQQIQSKNQRCSFYEYLYEDCNCKGSKPGGHYCFCTNSPRSVCLQFLNCYSNAAWFILEGVVEGKCARCKAFDLLKAKDEEEPPH